jgi:hypothetical protein
VEVSKAGFRTEVLPGLLLTTRQTLRVDATLQVGTTSQQVNVVADAGVITMETQTVS